MKIRADVAELLHAGYSDRAIARQLNVDPRTTVARARAALGIPKAKSGYKAASSAEDLYWRRVVPAEDGHMGWSGYHSGREKTPSLRYGGRALSAHRIAFRLAHGRDPDGHVRPGCDRPHCVAPAHQTDRITRAETRKVDALFDAIFGESA